MAPNPKHARQSSSEDFDEQEQQSRSLQSYIPAYLRKYVRPYHGDFCYTPIFHPKLIRQLMQEGFLPISCADFVLPKLHLQRCVISPIADLHVSKSTRKKASKFELTINTAFDNVVEGCRRQHGDHCWLYPQLVAAFRNIHNDDSAGPVHLYSVEVWNAATGNLAAGELGYSVGSIFTSLTGFSAEDSAGSVQLAALGRLLANNEFKMWDLGMEMDYKTKLGSHLMPRDEFVATVHSVREKYSHLRINTEGNRRTNCREIIDAQTKKNATASPLQLPNNKQKSPPPPHKRVKATTL